MAPDDTTSAARKYHRLSSGQRLEALAAVESELAKGKLHGAVVQEVGARFGVSSRTVKRLIAEVHARWSNESAASRPQVRLLVERQTAHVYAVALQSGNLNAALRAIELTCKLHGFLQPEKQRDQLPAQRTGEHSPGDQAALDEAKNRSPEDVEHFIQRGYWPEEAPRNADPAAYPAQAQTAKPASPQTLADRAQAFAAEALSALRTLGSNPRSAGLERLHIIEQQVGAALSELDALRRHASDEQTATYITGVIGDLRNFASAVGQNLISLPPAEFPS